MEEIPVGHKLHNVSLGHFPTRTSQSGPVGGQEKGKGETRKREGGREGEEYKKGIRKMVEIRWVKGKYA